MQVFHDILYEPLIFRKKAALSEKVPLFLLYLNWNTQDLWQSQLPLQPAQEPEQAPLSGQPMHLRPLFLDRTTYSTARPMISPTTARTI